MDLTNNDKLSSNANWLIVGSTIQAFAKCVYLLHKADMLWPAFCDKGGSWRISCTDDVDGNELRKILQQAADELYAEDDTTRFIYSPACADLLEPEDHLFRIVAYGDELRFRVYEIPVREDIWELDYFGIDPSQIGKVD